MSIKKKQRVLFHLLLFTFFVLIIGGNFDYSAESTQAQDSMPTTMTTSHWKLADHSDVLELNNAALRDAGHELAYRITRDGCQRSALQLRLNIPQSISQTYRGELVRLNVHVGEQRAMIYASVARVTHSAEQHSQIELASFIINPQLQADLKVNDRISFEILEPIALAEALDQSVTFSLNDFENSHALLRQLCEAEPVQKESSYTLFHVF